MIVKPIKTATSISIELSATEARVLLAITRRIAGDTDSTYHNVFSGSLSAGLVTRMRSGS